MANPHAVDPDSEDASNIMRVISVKNSCTDKPVIVQLIRFNNKVGSVMYVILTCWSYIYNTVKLLMEPVSYTHLTLPTKRIV